MPVFLLLLLLQSGDSLDGLRKEHPRLILLDSELPRLRRLIRDSEQARAIHRQLIKEAEAIQAAPPVEHRLVGPRLLSQSRRCLDRVYTLALLYRLDGNKQHLERAMKELRAAAAFPDWNPSHFLDTAEMTHAFAIGYDWFYRDLSDADRALLRDTIVRLGIEPALKVYRGGRGWMKSEHNWNQVCNGGIGLGALAIADERPEVSREVLEAARKSLPIALASYAPDGGWAEGPGYWHYATRYTVYFLAGLQTALGHDFELSQARGLDRAGHFRVCFSGPVGKTFNYADGGDSVGGAAEMFWLAQRYRQPVYSWHQQQQLQDIRRADAHDLIWYQPEAISPRAAGWPLDSVYRGINAAFLRSSWDSPDAIFVGVKGGDNQANHGQLDLGSFVLDAAGVRWAIDLGADDYNLPGYFDKKDKRWLIYRNRSESHNTVLLDNENQDLAAKAAVTALTEGRSPQVTIDLTLSYLQKLKSWQRTVSLPERRSVEIRDLIEASQPVEALWGMVTDATVELQGLRAMLRKGARSLSAEILAPKTAKFDTVSTTPTPPQRQNEGTRKLVVRLPEKVTALDLRVRLTPK